LTAQGQEFPTGRLYVDWQYFDIAVIHFDHRRWEGAPATCLYACAVSVWLHKIRPNSRLFQGALQINWIPKSKSKIADTAVCINGFIRLAKVNLAPYHGVV
jgi:hypothetical protein